MSLERNEPSGRSDSVEQPRILFADDEPGLVSAVIRRLEIRGIDACGVTSSLDALRKVEEEEFDVAILDVRMPDIGGLDMLGQFREKYPKMEIVLMSGHGSEENMTEGVRLGAFDYLQKPVEIEELVEVIRRAMARKAESRHG